MRSRWHCQLRQALLSRMVGMAGLTSDEAFSAACSAWDLLVSVTTMTKPASALSSCARRGAADSRTLHALNVINRP